MGQAARSHDPEAMAEMEQPVLGPDMDPSDETADQVVVCRTVPQATGRTGRETAERTVDAVDEDTGVETAEQTVVRGPNQTDDGRDHSRSRSRRTRVRRTIPVRTGRTSSSNVLPIPHLTNVTALGKSDSTTVGTQRHRKNLFACSKAKRHE